MKPGCARDALGPIFALLQYLLDVGQKSRWQHARWTGGRMDGWVVDPEVGRYTGKGTKQRLLWEYKWPYFKFPFSLSMPFISSVLFSICSPFPFLYFCRKRMFFPSLCCEVFTCFLLWLQDGPWTASHPNFSSHGTVGDSLCGRQCSRKQHKHPIMCAIGVIRN